MKCKVGRFDFDLVTSIHCQFPDSMRKPLLRAAKATLAGIPREVLEAKLKKNATYSLVLSVVSAPKIKALNSAYRNKHRPTDVLSFSQLEGIQLPTVQYHVGEVILCWSITKAQAKRLGVTQKEELARLTVHGVLHLFGYDHETNKRDEKIMFALQEKILEGL